MIDFSEISQWDHHDSVPLGGVLCPCVRTVLARIVLFISHSARVYGRLFDTQLDARVCSVYHALSTSRHYFPSCFKNPHRLLSAEMGQNTSTPRDQERLSRPSTRRSMGLRHAANLPPSSNSQEPTEDHSLLMQTGASPGDSARTPPHTAMFRRRASAQSTPPGRNSDGTDRAASIQDDVLYEQEERPLVNMEDHRMRDGPVTLITADPMPRPPSVISRLGSRLLPRYSIVGSATEAGDYEGRALRRRLSDTSPPPIPVETPMSTPRRRFSVFDSITGQSSSSRSGPRRRLAPISRPIPLSESPLDSRFGVTDATRQAPAPSQSNASPQQPNSTLISTLPRTSRLSRVRRSISGPIENLFGGSMNHSGRDRQAQGPPRRPSRTQVADEMDYLLPPLNVNDISFENEEPSISGFGGNDHSRIDDDFSSFPEPSNRRQSWTQRWAERTPLVRRDRQRAQGLMRGRSSRLIRRDDETPLSRILQLAAAAIAAQLAGSPSALPNMEAFGDDQFDGSLNNFVQELNNATSGAGPFGDENGNATAGGPPLNFWRVFRFGASGSEGRDELPESSQVSTSEQDSTENHRVGTVTLVVVGVRSVPSSSINRGSRENMESSLDTLLSLPLMPSENSRRNSTSVGLSGNSDSRSRLSPRRSSLGSAVTIPSRDAQHTQTLDERNTFTSEPGTTISTAAGTLLNTESPPGPNPPPSTPSDPSHLSNANSSSNSPRQRPSSVSAIHYNHNHRREEIGNVHSNMEEGTAFMEDNTSVPSALDDIAFTEGVRPRRRSDSETARHRDLGAGAARRNGVVEPDHAPGQGRSWLIYVVGTNLQSDHPAIHAPSLFTEVSGSPKFRSRGSTRGSPNNDG